MRAFICLFILSWLLGIVLAVNNVELRITFLVGGLVLAWLTLKGFKYQYIVAAAFLILAGVLWGQSSVENNRIAETCLEEEVSQGVVVKLTRLEGSRAQYLVETDTECLALLTTTPWPVYGVGSILDISGKTDFVTETQKKYPEYASYLISQGISSTLYYPNIEVITLENSWQNTVVTKLRQQTGKVFQEPVYGLVLTMTLAQRGSLSSDIVEQFRRTGTSHVLAISGLHMSLFAGMMLGVLLLMPISPLMRSVTVIILLWLYVAMIGFPISALRAVWFWTIFLSALRLGLLVSLPTVVLITGGSLISFNPLVVTEVSFQLSVSAVIGIGLMLFLVKGLPHYHVLKSSNAILDLVTISLGAALTTGPIIIYHFGQLSIASVLGNLVVVPLVPIFLMMAILALVSSFVIPSLSLLISFGVHLIWQWWNISTYYISSMPGVYFEELDISLFVVFIYYTGLLIISDFVVRKQRRSWREVWQ